MELISSAELDTSPIAWTAAGIIPRTGTGYAWGPPGAGKSLAFGIELGLAVASGTPFFGRATIAGPVVYALGEGLPGTGIRKQARLARQQRDDTEAIAVMARDHGDAAARAMAGALPAYDGEQLFIIDESFDVRLTAAGEFSRSMREAIAIIGDMAPELVILDAAGDFTGGASLSSDSNANKFAAGLKALAAALDCVVLVIAHPVAANTKMLGAGRLVAAADFVIEIQPDTAAAPGAPQTTSVISRKSKDGAGFETFGFVLEPASWPDTDPDTGDPVTVESATVRMLESSSARPGPPARSAPPALPQLAPGTPERPRKRSGIKRDRGGLHAVPDPRPPRGKVAVPGAVDREFVSRLLSVECPDCHALGGGQGCNTSYPGSGLVPLALDPAVLACHAARALDAWGAGRISEAEADVILAAVA